ncbi:MAG: cytidine deaminase [Candidatus Cloacimonadota bacterium]|nr:MAG: cytidine deaminase [Candidatus Cloacimonadota bacterium]
MKRPGWHQYFMETALLVATRTTCLRRKVGAVLVKNNQIIASGYNGAPKGITHCSVTGCLRKKMNVPSGKMHELCRGTHAEQNAIIQAAVNGTSIAGAILYCTTQPCIICSKMLINSEISTVYIAESYDDKFALEMLKEAGIKLIKVDKDTGECINVY